MFAEAPLGSIFGPRRSLADFDRPRVRVWALWSINLYDRTSDEIAKIII